MSSPKAYHSLRGNVATRFVRRVAGADPPRRRRRDARRRPQDPHRPAVDQARAACPRPDVPLPGLHVTPLRRPSRGALARRRPDEPRQPGAALPAPSPFGPRRAGRRAAARGRSLTVIGPDGAVLSPAPNPRRLPLLSYAASTDDELPTWDGTHFDVAYAIDVLYAPRAPERDDDDGFKAAWPRTGSSSRFRSP